MHLYLLVRTTDNRRQILSATFDPAKAEQDRIAAHRAHWAFHEAKWRASGLVRTWERHWAMAQAEDWSPRIEEIEVPDADAAHLIMDVLARPRIREGVATVLEYPTSRYNATADEAVEEARALTEQVLRTMRRGVAEALAG